MSNAGSQHQVLETRLIAAVALESAKVEKKVGSVHFRCVCPGDGRAGRLASQPRLPASAYSQDYIPLAASNAS